MKWFSAYRDRSGAVARLADVQGLSARKGCTAGCLLQTDDSQGENSQMKKIITLAIVAAALLPFSAHAEGIDEVAQLKKFKGQLGAYLDESNEDTRFIVDRNDSGAFSVMYNVGVIHVDDPNDTTRDLILGTATVISDCYALTSYHVIEGRVVIDGTKTPERNKHVRFSYGAVKGATGGFSNNALDSTVVDPGILDLTNRHWSNDVVLVRFWKKLKPGSYEKIQIGTLAGRSGINSSDATAFDSQFFVAAGYPITRFNSFKTGNLYADFCNPKGSIQYAGIETNCVLTRGMSGGPLFIYEKNPNSNIYSKTLVALHIQSAIGDGKFTKKSNAASLVAGLDWEMLKKIRKFTDQNLDENCQ